jgi:(4S)-4-hydroxy-5-phosphonooxypentane-2,3-dione isomerase
MQIVMVYVHVKSQSLDAFIEATLENARESVKEPGIARFDVVQQEDDPTRFILIEVYKTADAPAAHKATAHYEKWRDTVGEMMSDGRQGVKYKNLFPEDADW